MSRIGIVALALSACCVLAPSARAQFYSLEGRFQCLDDPKAVCFDATSDGPLAQPSQVVAQAPAAAAVARPAQKPRVAVAVRGAPAAGAPADTLVAIARRVEARQLAPEDAANLRRLAQAGDKRALELFAWCTLQGVGVARDPLQAYLLYGVAADLGIAEARRNQAIIYEDNLTPDQRQQALTIENGVTQTRVE